MMWNHAFIFTLGLCLFGQSSVAADPTAIADRVNRIIWQRFIGSDNVMYDYAGLNGEVVLPTPTECENNIPNALAWWTPIENGGFFNGMYLVAQCDRYNAAPTPENREKVQRLVKGLYLLQDVGDTPGFIARGVGSDGRCHYIASSNDQNFPWFLGLGKYLETDIPDAQARAECAARLVRHAEALQKQNWLIPGDRPDFTRGWWLDGEYTANVHIATATRVLFEATGDEKWRTLHNQLLNEKAPNGKIRIETIAAGAPDVANWSAWFLSNCQYAVRELHRRETDPERKLQYAKSLNNTAEKAAPLILRYKKFDPRKERRFTPDWHVMIPPYRPQQNGGEAQKLAMEQSPRWNAECPAIAEEKGIVKPAICSAWIVALAENEELKAANMPEILNALNHFDYGKLYYATFFYVENLVNTLDKIDRK